MIYTFEFERLYPKYQFDEDQYVIGQMTPFKMILEKEDFTALLRMAFFNITRYDGLTDTLFPSVYVPPPKAPNKLARNFLIFIFLFNKFQSQKW